MIIILGYWNHFSLRYIAGQCKTQKKWDKAVDDCLPTLKFVSDWLVTRKMIKKIFNDLYADENKHCFNADSSNVVFIYVDGYS